MLRPELLLDRELREILTPLNVGMEGVTEEVATVFVSPEGNPNLTRRLTDSFYNHWGKIITATGVIGAGSLSYVTFNALGSIDNSWHGLAVKGVILASSVVGGLSIGFMSGLVGGLGIALVGEHVERVEDMIRRRFT